MKLLVFRMSSLGDVLLSTAFLENLPADIVVDWVIRSEFEFVLRNHPRIRRLIVFDKKTGFRNWLSLIRRLNEEDYDAHVDLHVILRTHVARFYGAVLRWIKPNGRKIQFFSISKGRVRFMAYILFKGLLPKGWRPIPYWIRYGTLARKVAPVEKTGELRPPSFLPQLEKRNQPAREVLNQYGLQAMRYFAVMPASRWRSKEWGVEKYACLCAEIRGNDPILLLGRDDEPACRDLLEMLQRRGILHVSALTEKDFEVTAMLLQNARCYIGGDTGLAHLAEAVGTPAVVIFGPTRPDLGFGPRIKESISVCSAVACSPCSKDGRICCRFFEPYACLKSISIEAVEKAVKNEAIR